MNTLQTVSPQQIINTLQTMPLDELEHLVDKVLTLQAQRRAPHVSADESGLLKIIERELLSNKEKNRMRDLQRLRDAEQLSNEGYAELAALVDRLEEQHAERMSALAKLAALRGVSLETVMQQVGLNLPDYE